MAAVEGVGTAADDRPPGPAVPGPAGPGPGLGRGGPRERLLGVDAARGLALVGVFVAHMGVPLTLLLTGAPDVHAVWEEDYSGPGMLVVEAVGGLVSGRSAALFAFLAGVSLVLLAGRARPGTRVERNRVRVRIAVRALLLVAIGYALATLGSLSVILHFYGVYFLLAIPLLWLRTRHLAALAVAAALVGPQATLAVQHLPAELGWSGAWAGEEEWTAEDEAEWEATWGDPEWVAEKEEYWASLEESGEDPLATEEGFAEDMPLFSLEALEDPLDLLVFGLYPATVFLAYVLAGMVAARTGLRSRRVRWWLVGGGAGLAVLGYGSSWLLLGPLARFLPGEDEYSLWRMPLEAGSHSNTTFEVLGNTGVAMAVLGLCLLLAGTRPMRVVLYPVAAMGAMTLTLYTAHGVVLWAVYGGLLPGWAGWVETYTVEAVLACSLVTATVWRLTLGAGPMERPVTAVSRAVARWTVRDRSAAPREGAAGTPS